MHQFFQWLLEVFQGAKFWAIVLPWERGLRVRLGRWVKLWEPGFHWRVPFLDDVRTVNTRTRIASVPCVTVTTKDGKTVTAAGCVSFRITDPYKALLTIQQPEDAASALSMAAIAGYIIACRVDQLSIAALEEAALASLKIAPLGGLEFQFVKVIDFAIVRTYRLLMETWRPNTGFTNLEPPKQ